MNSQPSFSKGQAETEGVTPGSQWGGGDGLGPSLHCCLPFAVFSNLTASCVGRTADDDLGSKELEVGLYEQRLEEVYVGLGGLIWEVDFQPLTCLNLIKLL